MSCPYSEIEDQGSTTIAGSTPIYTVEQIALQLTDRFWDSQGGSRKFDTAPGGTLTVDLSDLAEAGQSLARQALDAWTVVTGIRFVEVSGSGPASGLVIERSDAAEKDQTSYSMNVGEDFTGTLADADRDAVAVVLAAGQNIAIELSGDNRSGNPTRDPYLRVYDATGRLIDENDDAQGRDSALVFQAAASGTYYLEAGSYGEVYPGDYRLSVRAPKEAGAPDITFDDEASGAYATSSVVGNTIQSSFINVNKNWVGGEDRIDGYHFQTYVHEIGHALGLGHAGNYNGSAQYGTDNHYANDSWQMSVMSYFDQRENTAVDASYAYAITPMMADVLAIQNLYGMPSANPGNTVYGSSGGTSGSYLDQAFDLSRPVAATVFDTGGRDVFDFSDESAHQRLDLRIESFSDVGGMDGNLAIAHGTVIEIGRTGTGNDTLIGNVADNGLIAGFGADVLDGLGGNDALSGQAGRDTMSGGDGRDAAIGGGGGDFITGGGGGDLLIGGDVSLDLLTDLFPGWTPPPRAQALLNNGDILALWTDILDDLEIA